MAKKRKKSTETEKKDIKGIKIDIKPLEQLDKICELQGKIKEYTKEIIESVENIEKSRNDLVNLILGPALFGDEKYFRLFKYIHGAGTEHEPAKISSLTGNRISERFETLFMYSENEQEQLFLRVCYKGAYRSTALISDKKEQEIEIHQSAWCDSDARCRYPAYATDINRNRIKSMGLKLTPIDQLVECYQTHKSKMAFDSFLNTLSSAASFILSEHQKICSNNKNVYENIQKQIKKLKAVVEL